jgi:c-di-GMP phosphodiesterase
LAKGFLIGNDRRIQPVLVTQLCCPASIPIYHSLSGNPVSLFAGGSATRVHERAFLVNLLKILRFWPFLAAAYVAIVAGAAQSFHLAQQFSLGQQNTTQLEEMTQQLIHRVDLAIDYAVVVLGDQVAADISACGHDDVMNARTSILNHGFVKDIEVLSEPFRVTCSVSGNHPIEYEEYLERFPALNDDISLQALDRRSNGLFRVRWRVESDISFAAILNIDPLLYDLFPAALRDKGQARIVLGNSYDIARFGEAAKPAPAEAHSAYEASSRRYPVKVQVSVGTSDLASWNAGSENLGYGAGAIFGALLGLWLVLTSIRPLDMIEELKLAISQGHIKPYFQPTFSMADRSIVGCEVLVRWIKPDGTLIRPDRFIPVAETTGLIVPMTERLFRTSLTALAPVLKSRPGFKVAFNVAPSHFVAPKFLEKLRAVLDDMNVACDHIVIELTERQSIDSSQEAARVAEEARKLGMRIALDDAGSGHNGLSNIQDVPLNIIKIDKKFVDFVGQNTAASSIVNMLVKLSADLGASTVAEGIETEAQFMVLRECGVDEGQGYLVAPALEGSKFIEFLARHQLSEAKQLDLAAHKQAA